MRVMRLFGLAAILASSVEASGTLRVLADRPCRVFIDGEEVGVTPILIRELEPGRHAIRIQETKSGREVSRPFLSPRIARVEKTLTVRWAGERPVVESILSDPAHRPAIRPGLKEASQPDQRPVTPAPGGGSGDEFEPSARLPARTPPRGAGGWGSRNVLGLECVL